MLIHYRINLRTQITTIFIILGDILVIIFWCSRDDANMTYLSAINYRVFTAMACILTSVESDDHTLKALFDCVSYSILKPRWAIFFSLVICIRLIAPWCRAMLTMLAIVLPGKPAYGWQNQDVHTYKPTLWFHLILSYTHRYNQRIYLKHSNSCLYNIKWYVFHKFNPILAI